MTSYDRMDIRESADLTGNLPANLANWQVQARTEDWINRLLVDLEYGVLRRTSYSQYKYGVAVVFALVQPNVRIG